MFPVLHLRLRVVVWSLVWFGLLFSAPSQAGNNAGQAFAIWPDTGQFSCYDASGNVLNPCPAPGQPFFGQDAQCFGPARSYTKMNEAGIDLPASATSWAMVRDNVTGLIWEAKQAKDGVADYSNPHDADNTYTWCDTNPNTNNGERGTCGANDTKNFLDALNSGNGTGGHTDWRLPTFKELQTLVDMGRHDPALADGYFMDGQSYDGYWSATSYWMPEIAYVVYFYIGSGGNASKGDKIFVRAVRGGPVHSGNRFVDNHDGTVTDSVTGLQWQQATADNNGDGTPDTMDWENALAYAEDLRLAGHDDWRLPNDNELTSIVDYSRSSPSIDIAAFPGTKRWKYWSSTTSERYYDYAWSITFEEGFEFSDKKSEDKSYVRSVRGRRCNSVIPNPKGISLVPVYRLLLREK